MNGSILTNQGAMVALQTMKSINKNLSMVQDSISTGKRVATSKDNAAIWAISSVMESDVSSFKAVTDSLALGQSTVSVARNASEQVKDSLIEIKSKIIAAQEENVDRDKIQADVDAIRSQIKSIVGASQFNGLNLLKGSEDLEVLSSLDRSQNGSTTTSTINVEAKSLDSGTNAVSVVGTSIVAATNVAGATVTAAFSSSGNTNEATVTDGKGTLGKFTNGTQTITFGTDTALDEGDTLKLRFSDGTNSFDVTYTQTATSTAQTTGEEVAKQLSLAYAAFAARDSQGNTVSIDTGTANVFTSVGEYDKSTKTYTAAEGNFVFTNGAVGTADALNTLSLSENAGVLTVTNLRDTAVSVTAEDLNDFTQTSLTDVALLGDNDTGAGSATDNQLQVTTGAYTLDIAVSTGDGIQKDDTYAVKINQDGATTDNNALTITLSNARLTESQMADTIKRAFDAFKTGNFLTSSTSYTGSDTLVTYGGAAGKLNINGATVALTYVDAGAVTTEAAFKSTLQGTGSADDFDATNGATGQVVFSNNTASVFGVSTDITIGSASTAAQLDIGSAANYATASVAATPVATVAAGTVGKYLTVDVNNTANQVGDTLSVTLEGVNLDSNNVAQPITYTTTNGNTEAQTATGFAAAINTALAASGVKDVVASTRTGGLIDIKNYNITTTKDVSKLSVTNELTTAAVATLADGTTAATTIAAGATNKVNFAATKPTKGDTYSVTVGSTTAKYTARKGDSLNDIGKNIEGLLKLKSSDNITVDFTTVDDPASTGSVLTVKNNGTSAISSFSATVKSGGTAGGGLELLDQINVTDSKKAEGSLDLIEGLISVAIDAASSYGSSEKRLESQQTFISKLTDSLKSGIGSLVDANLEETSARLQALQVQQQLGTQALSIANQAPQSILSLFR
jgi:flagellin